MRIARIIACASMLAGAALAASGCSSGSGSLSYIGPYSYHGPSPWLVKFDEVRVPVIAAQSPSSDAVEYTNLVIGVTAEVSNTTSKHDQAVENAEDRLEKMQPLVAQAMFETFPPGSSVMRPATIESETGNKIINPDKRPGLEIAREKALKAATETISAEFARFPEAKEVTVRVYVTQFHLANP